MLRGRDRPLNPFTAADSAESRDAIVNGIFPQKLIPFDALTPTLSHREREQTLKTATWVAVLHFPRRDIQQPL